MRFYLVVSTLIVFTSIAIIARDLVVNQSAPLLSPQTHKETFTQQIAANIQKKLINTSSSLQPTPIPSPLPQDVIIDVINKERINKGLSSLKIGKQTCSLLDAYVSQQELNNSQISSICPACQRVNISSIPPQTSIEDLQTYINHDVVLLDLIHDKDFTHYCLKDSSGSSALALVVAVPSKTITASTTSSQTKNISEDELWQALSEYRKANTVSDLNRDENLCIYARKRVDDHLKMLQSNKPKEEYPVPAKYPLDAHDGFKKDADSGYVFDIAKKHVVAENLAFWPSATYATHVIEWGWDTSTEGHRETQLSREYTHGCLTGKDGFFVAIYGRD